MLAWILLGFLVSLPWVAPRLARTYADRRWTYVGTADADAGAPFQNGWGNAEEMRISGSLQRAKAEGAGWFRDALDQRRSTLRRLRRL